MSTEILESILEVLPKVLQEHDFSFFSLESSDWYLKRKQFLEQNSMFLDKIIEHIQKEFHKDCSKEDLFYMQKLYLCYSNEVPRKLLTLSFEHIKIILNLYSYDKRKFYIDLCYEQEWDIAKLSYYISHDLYEKYQVLVLEVHDYDEVCKPDFLRRLLEIETFLYEEL